MDSLFDQPGCGPKAFRIGMVVLRSHRQLVLSDGAVTVAIREDSRCPKVEM